MAARGVGGCCIGARQELEKQGVGGAGSTECVVRQDEPSQVCVKVSARWYGSITEARRFGIRIGEESCARESIVTRPEAGAAHLMRIGLTRNRVRQTAYAAPIARSPPPAQTSDRNVATTPQ